MNNFSAFCCSLLCDNFLGVVAGDDDNGGKVCDPRSNVLEVSRRWRDSWEV